MRSAWIISIGTELSLGQTVDTNSAWLAGRLAELGIRTVRHVTVADEVEPIRCVLREAAADSDLVLVSGGLGPTEDDLTRQAVADVAGVPLELHQPSLDHLREFFTARGRQMPASNTVQAMIPRTGRALPNPCGTAPGIWIELGATPCFVMPGVPSEMRAMFEQEVRPHLRAATRGSVILSRRLHTFGLGESDLGRQIADLMQRGRNPEVGTTAELGIVGVRVNAAAASPADAARMLDQMEAELRRRLGEVVFGRDGDTLGGVVGRLLVEAGATVSTAESCTGGLVGGFLTDVPGSSRYYRGGVVAYDNRVKQELLGVAAEDLERFGAVSAEVARSMADGVARRLATDYALAITGIAGPDGGTASKPVGLVFIGMHAPRGTEVRECHFGSDASRQMIRMRAARTALNDLRLALSR